jgi:hypothetical protein
MRGLILGLDFLEPKRLRKKLLMDNLSKRMRANTLNYQKPILILKAFDLKSKKYPYSPKTPNLHKRQNLINLRNSTKVNEYYLGKECDPLCIHWKISIFIKGIAAIYPIAFYCSSRLFIPPKELITLNKPALHIKMSNST